MKTQLTKLIGISIWLRIYHEAEQVAHIKKRNLRFPMKLKVAESHLRRWPKCSIWFNCESFSWCLLEYTRAHFQASTYSNLSILARDSDDDLKMAKRSCDFIKKKLWKETSKIVKLKKKYYTILKRKSDEKYESCERRSTCCGNWQLSRAPY